MYNTDGSYSVSDIHNCFEYNMKKRLLILQKKIYINKIENTIMLKIKTGYYLELLTPETIKLLGSTKSKITKDENGENFIYLEITEAVSVHCNIVNNNGRVG